MADIQAGPHLPHLTFQTSAGSCSATVGPIDSPFAPLEAESNPLSDKHRTVAHDGVPRVPRAFLGFPPKFPTPLTPASTPNSPSKAPVTRPDRTVIDQIVFFFIRTVSADSGFPAPLSPSALCCPD